eukprot:TRINITY_DN4002_c2_g1_i2.p1 TRINITY_DN4002_c2_g1~~TRINITY_DN4002_c2_g1_i2.p1  ORF type:complete len:412 (+),score=94.47 TRINITY_DN4002_c2_g1_i2:384-1619(+)
MLITAACAGLAAAAPETVTLVLLRAGVGVGSSGVAVPYALLAELTPPRMRGRHMLGVWMFWALGSVAVVLLAWATLDTPGWGWRGFAGAGAVPCGLCVLLYPLIPESPRWLLRRGRVADAEAAVREMAFRNHATLPSGFALSSHTGQTDVPGVAATLRELWGSRLVRTTLPLWLVWIGFGFVYYGVVMLVNRLFESDGSGSSDAPDFDYPSILVSATAEFAGVALAIPLVDVVGRRKLQAALYAVCGAACLASGLAAAEPRWVLLPLTLVARAAAMGSSCVTWLVTPELYPTDIRARGQTYANGFGFIGSIVSPFVIDSPSVSDVGVGAVVLSLCAVCAVAAMHLPFETAGARLDASDELRPLRQPDAKHSVGVPAATLPDVRFLRQPDATHSVGAPAIALPGADAPFTKI